MHVSVITNSKWIIPVATGVAGTLIGVGTGFIIGVRKGHQDVIDEVRDYVESSEAEYYGVEGETPSEGFVMDVNDYEAVVQANGETEEHEETVFVSDRLLNEDEVADAVKGPYDDELEITEAPDEEEDEEDTVEINVFADHIWDEEYEASLRVENQPYIIPVAAYTEDEYGYIQETVTYYAGDDTMAQQDDQPIPAYEAIMGELKFGYGSGDADSVYIRNDSLKREWEVLRVSGMYTVEVMGADVEMAWSEQDLKHANGLRFRDD